MITFKMKNFNIDINNYLEFVANLEVKTIKCPYCGTAHMERHGYYRRYINISETKHYIKILRVRCKICGRTHAVLPDFIIPYLHEPIKDMINVVTSKTSSSIEDNIKKNKYKIEKKWKPMLHSLCLTFIDELYKLVLLCSKRFKMCIMQIHRGNYFFMG